MIAIAILISLVLGFAAGWIFVFVQLACCSRDKFDDLMKTIDEFRKGRGR